MVTTEGGEDVYEQTVYLSDAHPMEEMTEAAEEVTITTDVDEMVPEAVAEVHVIEEYREENYDVQVVDDIPGAVLAEEVLDIEHVGRTDQLADIRQAIKAKVQVKKLMRFVGFVILSDRNGHPPTPSIHHLCHKKNGCIRPKQRRGGCISAAHELDRPTVGRYVQ